MSSRTPAQPYRFPWVGLLTLAGAVFVSVTSEFLPTGLLPDMARELGTNLSVTGLLVTIFAATVVAGTTPLAALTRSQPRKRLVVLVLLVIAIANLGSALAPTYPLLVVARVLGGLAHGLFWAVVATYGAHLVPKERLGLAIAITSAGGSAAFVLGVPVGTGLGHALGWRAAFGVLAIAAGALAVLVVLFLPAVRHGVDLATGAVPLPLRQDRSVPKVVLLCLVIVLTITGQNTLYTYMAPWFTDVAHLGADAVPGLLLLYGAGGVVGLVAAGFAADRLPKAGIAVAFLACVASVVVLATGAGSTPVVITAFLLWGVAFGAVPPLVQTRMMRTASPRARDLAGALQTTAFNVGIGGGALFGALLLAGPGMGALPLAQVGLTIAGLALGLLPGLARRPVLRPATAE